MVHELLSRILAAPAPLVLAVVGLVVLAEDALFVGFVIPGETVAILGGVAASLGHVPLAAVLAVVVAAAVAGDTIGFEVGRRLGPRILAARILERHRSRLDEARGLLGRRGGWAVFLGRWTAFFRAVMPALAGTSPMSYRRFFVFNATGGLLWGVAVVVAGYLAGASYGAVDKAFGRDAGLAGVLVVAVVAMVWHLRRRRPAAQPHPGD